jgi:DNA-binding MarR family transcriptional regulator
MAAPDGRGHTLDEIDRLFQDLSWVGRQRLNRRIERFGLTVPQYTALLTIERLGPNVTMSAVTDVLQLPPSSLTSIADRLVREGLVERGALPVDRRSVAVTITAAGRDLVGTVQREQHDALVGMLADVPDADLDRFREVLATLLAGVSRAMTEPAMAGAIGEDRSDGMSPSTHAV